jgi:lipid II:glycine glycyltransferase (peptidoglycan interpeptide bridge formation enzyme)
MAIRPLSEDEEEAYNKIVDHPLQSYEWGEFREKTGIKVIRRGLFEGEKLVDGFTLTLHPIPHTRWNIGYLPKGKLPSKELLDELQKIGREERCVFIQLEPNVIVSQNTKSEIRNTKLVPAAHPLFTKYTFVLDLTKSEEELLKDMHPKTRYNIRVATKHDVHVKIDNSDGSFEKYWKLTSETTKRQGFYAHTKQYHRHQWDLLHHITNETDARPNDLSSFILNGSYDGKVLTSLLFFAFKDTLYYPYGASSNEHRNVMHSTLTMWEGIKLGKRLGLKKFDMWGAAEVENPETSNPYYGFHRFKQGFGPTYTEFVGSYDLVINSPLYAVYKVADKLRWAYLRIKK